MSYTPGWPPPKKKKRQHAPRSLFGGWTLKPKTKPAFGPLVVSRPSGRLPIKKAGALAVRGKARRRPAALAGLFLGDHADLGGLGKFKIKIKKPKIKPFKFVAKATGTYKKPFFKTTFGKVVAGIGSVATVAFGVPAAAGLLGKAGLVGKTILGKLASSKSGQWWANIGGRLHRITKFEDGKVQTEEIPAANAPPEQAALVAASASETGAVTGGDINSLVQKAIASGLTQAGLVPTPVPQGAVGVPAGAINPAPAAVDYAEGGEGAVEQKDGHFETAGFSFKGAVPLILLGGFALMAVRVGRRRR